MNFKKNILLKNQTTFRIGGAAKYFFEAKTKTELISAIKLAKKRKLPFFILGGGSNLLVSDKGFNGLVIKIRNSQFVIHNSKIITEAGVMLGKLLNTSVEKSLTGLEWVAGIPGTIGGAIRGNAGAFGKEMKDIIKKVEVFDVKELRIKNYELGDCKFAYRDSIFKKNKNLIILSVVFKLKNEKQKNIQEKIKKYLNYRKKTQPLNFYSAGSVFKNPQLNKKLLKNFPELKKFNKNNLIPVGYLIEKCDLKGKRIDNVQISEKHSNFIVNLSDGKAKDVINLIKLIKEKVKKKFGIVLEEEIQYLGFKN
jgi:UDP-N-acetylmuramate dehydrogenase